jgi:predicted nucleic acid-binding protein
MTLVDTSVWVDHLKVGNARLVSLLESGDVLTHPFIIGEIACGSLRRRGEILGLLAALPGVPVADHSDVLFLVESQRLFGHGIGWIDVHLLASARLAHVQLLTLDRPLVRAAALAGVST